LLIVEFGAVPDTWTDLMPAYNFNAGVMALTPDVAIYDLLLNMTMSAPLDDDAEQGVLNRLYRPPVPGPMYPSRFTRTILPMKYNLNVEAYSSHRDQWDDIWPTARIIHFTVWKPMWAECPAEGECRFEQPARRWWSEYREMNGRYGWEAAELS
jgi:hypothetical protein